MQQGHVNCSKFVILILAISDIIYLTVLFSEACANRISGTCLHGEFMCMLLPFWRRPSAGLSAYSVAVFNIQRYTATVNPFHVRVSSPPTWRVTVATICGVWIVATLFAVSSAVSKYLCKRSLYAGTITNYHLVVIFELLVFCLFPICLITFTYIMTARHLVESSCSICGGAQNPQLNTIQQTLRWYWLLFFWSAMCLIMSSGHI
jgi:hypothetical protein